MYCVKSRAALKGRWPCMVQGDRGVAALTPRRGVLDAHLSMWRRFDAQLDCARQPYAMQANIFLYIHMQCSAV
jgi:hypothetical protein